MSLFSRVVEALETAARLVPARASHAVALERFLAAHRPSHLPADTDGLIAADLPAPRPALVSIVILTLDGAAMLRTLLASLERFNTWPDIEIILVDHGSDNETKDVVAAASAKFHIRHVRPGRNHSFAFSCNRGAQMARGEIVLFLNNDIELTEDVVPRIVAGVQATGGLVGIKLLHKHRDGQATPHPQIGVRFRWNLRQGWTMPYDATPTPRDGLRAHQPCRMPAVTAAVLACDRAQFLQMGGFCEVYLYAYEDVDLCLKAAARFDLPLIVLNDVSAVHLMGATRTKRAKLRRRIRWNAHSRGIFRARYGYRARRLAWAGLFAAGGFEWGRRPVVALLADRNDKAAHTAMGALAGAAAEFVLLKTRGLKRYDLFGCDLVLSRSPRLPLSRARNLSPMAITVGWAHDGDDAWQADTAAFDIMLASRGDRAAILTEALGRPVIAIGDRPLDVALRDAVADFLQNRFRIVILASADRSDAAARISAVLRAAGHAVRMGAAHGRHPISLRDDVALWLTPPGTVDLPADAMHVAAFEPVPGQPIACDIQVESLGDDLQAWFDRLMLEICAAHRTRMTGPEDLPLEDLSLADDRNPASNWHGRPDPTAHLIDAS